MVRGLALGRIVAAARAQRAGIAAGQCRPYTGCMRDGKAPDPRRLDVGAFVRAHQSLEGRVGIDELPRLRASVLAPPPGSAAPAFEWVATGSFDQPVGREALMRLHLVARGTVQLTCQRCLEPIVQALAVDNRLRFVASETDAERLDEQTDDEDVLALPARLDLVELVEDELLLALPLVPRHEHCAHPLQLPPADEMPAPDEAAADSPFAQLQRLRGKGGA